MSDYPGDDDYIYNDEDDEKKSGETNKDNNSVRTQPSFEHSVLKKLVNVDDDIVTECGATDLSGKKIDSKTNVRCFRGFDLWSVPVEDVILWYNQTKPISHNKFVISTDPRISIGDDYQLRINVVRATDAGQYNCTILPDNIAMQVNLEVEGKSTAVILDMDGRDISGRQLNYKQGARIEIQCEAEGNPTSQIKWFWNGERVKSGNNVQVNNERLIIANADNDHAKMYQCLADPGYAFVTINVLCMTARQVDNCSTFEIRFFFCNSSFAHSQLSPSNC